MKIKFKINGKPVFLETEPQRRLLDILRDDLDLISVKEGCGKGECGSCTVIYNGRRVNSCLVPALQLNGSNVYTLEGIQKLAVFRSIEEVFLENGAVQCGFCIPGMVLSTLAFLKESDPPYRSESIKWAIAGNMCRCTGYNKIIKTISDLGQRSDLVLQVRREWPQ
jgi:aerobic-type carbon monoxide dehydrogenase small subunit (CoxS/CutS family)